MWVIQFIFLLFIFLGGMYFHGKYTNPQILENLENHAKPRCPNMLVQIDSKYFLYNTNLNKVPGVNPIEFSNLEDYTEFVKWQQSVGLKCPVLYLQNTYDAQGNRVYKIRPDVVQLQGGLPPTTLINNHIQPRQTNTSLINSGGPQEIESRKRDKNDYEIDPSKIKKILEAQKIEFPESLAPLTIPKFFNLSDDPMDVNWGGPKHTEKSVASGKYEENEVLFY